MSESHPVDKKKVEDIAATILQLNQEEYRTLMCTIADHNPHPSVTSYITNKFQKARKKTDLCPSTTSDGSLKLFSPGVAPQLKPGRIGKSSRALESSPSASLLPDLHGISAWQVPFIFRGDLVPKGGKIFIDVEKLSMKLGWCRNKPKKHVQVANNVAIVDDKGTLLFWAFIKRDTLDICQYFTKIHRITKSKMLEGVTLESIRPILTKCFENNTVIGAKVKDDIAALSTQEELNSGIEFRHSKLYDIQDFYKSNDGAYKLKDIVAKFFPTKSANYQVDFHSSINDARATMQCYLKIAELQQSDPGLMNASSLNITRSTNEKFVFDKNDQCKCKK